MHFTYRTFEFHTPLSAQIPKEEEFVFQFNEDSLEVKSEISSDNEKASKRVYMSTQNINKTSSPCSSVKHEIVEPLTQTGKKTIFDEDEDSIISVVN